MSVSKDKKTEKWMVQIRVKDWTGKIIHKKKRGFDTKREAQQWERDFINQANSSLGMSFKDFIDIYMKDMEQRLKSSTVAGKHWMIDIIRHSHASLLVEMGFSPLLIAERLGHERVQTTLETYSHLYPNKQIEVANQLNDVMS